MNKKLLILVPVIAVIVILVAFLVKPKAGNNEVQVISPTQEPITNNLTDEEKIKEILDNKYALDPTTTQLTIMVNTGEYAKGGYGTKSPQGGGGLWFAAKTNGQWEIVYDGNGIITCDKLENYPDYPKDIIPQCWDEASNAMIDR